MEAIRQKLPNFGDRLLTSASNQHTRSQMTGLRQLAHAQRERPKVADRSRLSVDRRKVAIAQAGDDQVLGSTDRFAPCP